MIEEIEPGFYKELFAEDDLFILEEGAPDLKDVCIVLDKPLNSKNETFLGKILTAVKLSLYNTSQLDSAQIPSAEDLKTKYVIIFDENHPEDIPMYTADSSQNPVVLKCDNLDKIYADKVLKGQLWGELQKIFL